VQVQVQVSISFPETEILLPLRTICEELQSSNELCHEVVSNPKLIPQFLLYSCFVLPLGRNLG
jgi:hypothetical protein